MKVQVPAGREELLLCVSLRSPVGTGLAHL